MAKFVNFLMCFISVCIIPASVPFPLNGSREEIGHPQIVPCGLVKSQYGLYKEIPWAAYIRFFHEKVQERHFLGTIVGPQAVLIAASDFRMNPSTVHRIYSSSNYEAIILDEDKFSVPISGVSHIATHPGYNWPAAWPWNKHDFALVHLKDEIPFVQNNLHVPACIPQSDNQRFINFKPGTHLWILGNNRRLALNDTKALKVIVQDPEICKARWIEEDHDTGNAEYTGRICVQPVAGQENVVCTTGSFGVFAQRDNGHFEIIGKINNFYSDRNASRTCTPNALFFIEYLTQESITWIQLNLKCGSSSYACWNGQCIPQEGICNQVPECDDKSDEDEDMCQAMTPCDDDLDFRCTSSYGPCINKQQVCDGHRNCPNGEDETDELCLPPSFNVWVITGSAVTLVILVSISLTLGKKYHDAKIRERGLTKEQVKLFYDGDPTQEANEAKSTAAEKKPYDKSKELVLNKTLMIDEMSILGEGEYGKVHLGRAKLRNHKSEISEFTEMEVAVKTLKNGSPHEFFDALISELKILDYVGHHENIIQYFGACTAQIQKRILYIAVEYCENKDLETYLKANRRFYEEQQTFADVIREYQRLGEVGLQQHHTTYVKLRDTQTPDDFLKWAKQIVNGMCHLESIDLAHGDLAARNILLTKDKYVKISDFGLAHRTYARRKYGPRPPNANNENKNRLIPWCWMSPEALQFNSITSKSDVWSFGVTLWEICTLGQTPYQGSQCDHEFFTWLVNGGRLHQPKYASPSIYNIIMKNCWSLRPETRPTFQDLKRTFDNQSIT